MFLMLRNILLIYWYQSIRMIGSSRHCFFTIVSPNVPDFNLYFGFCCGSFKKTEILIHCITFSNSLRINYLNFSAISIAISQNWSEIIPRCKIYPWISLTFSYRIKFKMSFLSNNCSCKNWQQRGINLGKFNFNFNICGTLSLLWASDLIMFCHVFLLKSVKLFSMSCCF